MAITFARVERKCPHNAKENASGKKSLNLIFDFQVSEDGVRKACFASDGPRKRSFELVDLSGERVRQPGHYGGAYSAANAKMFQSVYLQAKSDGQIPTAEQIAERKAAREHDENSKAREARIRNSGLDLLEALKSLCDTTRHCDGRPLASDFDRARVLIAQIG